MATLVLRLLGAPAILEAGVARPLPLDLRTALIGLVAFHDAPLPRERIVAVFWPDSRERVARQNLRQLLLRTRDLLGGEGIETTRATIALRCQHDLRALRAAIDAGDALAVARDASDRFLDGLELIPNQEWQAWLAIERDRLSEAARRLVLEAARTWARQGPPASALPALAAWVDRDPFDDDLHAAYLRCARHVPSEAAAAAARLARVSAIIERETGGGLAEAVVIASTWLGEQGSVDAHAADVDGTQQRQRRRGGYTAGDLPLLGRDGALAALEAFVADETIRVVTVHGPGGIGKTRLVQEWAHSRAPPDVRVPLVSLAGAEDPADAVRRLVQAYGWQVGDEDAVAQLAARLAHGPPVIAFDEAEGKDWLPAWIEGLLAAAPHVSIVLASRERLGIVGEQILRLPGLAFPTGEEDATSAHQSDAVRLFAAAARRVRPDLTLGPDDLAAIAGFARRVDGSPLALTVAAGWLQLGPPARLLDDVLDDSGDPLAINDVMARSWDALEEADVAALAALSVFPERFDVDAALAVGACQRTTLRRLIDRSLVQPGTADGFALHALVRRHAAWRLADDPQAQAQARARHARHVGSWLGPLAGALWGGPDQYAAYTTILARLADLRQAWWWACEQADAGLLDALLDTLWCLEIRGWYALGAEFATAAVEALSRLAGLDPERAELPLARALARRGIFAQRLGDVDTTRETAERARAIFERRGVRVDPFVWFHLGIAAYFDGDLEAYEVWHQRLLAEAEAAGDRWAAAGAHSNLAILARDQGDLDAAEVHARAGLTDMTSLLDGWGTALSGHLLADVLAQRGGREAEALEVLSVAITQAERFGMEPALVESTVLLGDLLARLDRTEAEAAFRRAQALLDQGVMAGVRSPERGGIDAEHFRQAIDAGLRRCAASRRRDPSTS